jgi:hypothetical protein
MAIHYGNKESIPINLIFEIKNKGKSSEITSLPNYQFIKK